MQASRVTIISCVHTYFLSSTYILFSFTFFGRRYQEVSGSISHAICVDLVSNSVYNAEKESRGIFSEFFGINAQQRKVGQTEEAKRYHHHRKY